MNKNLLDAISESYREFLNPNSEYSERSNKKIIPIHSFVADVLHNKLGDDFIIKSLGYDSCKEANIEGKYYDKDVDISISYKSLINRDIGGISVKFITGNYKQNANNFFENLLGETANLRRVNYKYANVLIIPKYVPYYTNKPIKLSKIEEVNENNLLKYLKLENDNVDLLYKPDLTYLKLIDTGTYKLLEKHKGQLLDKNKFKELLLEEHKISSYDYKNDNDFSKELKEFLDKVGDFDKFIDCFCNLIRANTYSL